MSLSKAQILEASDLPTETVDVPEWGGTVTIRTMSGLQRDEWQRAWAKYAEEHKLGDSDGVAQFYAMLAVFTVCDDKGEALFGVDDVHSLASKSPRALKRIHDAAVKLNRIGVAAVEEAQKNS